MSLAPSSPRALAASAWPRWIRSLRGLAYPMTAILVTTLICSLFGLLVARGAALLLVSSEEPPPPSGREAPAALAGLDEEGDDEVGGGAASRNLFCHRCGAEDSSEGPAKVGGGSVAGAGAPEASLVATVSTSPASGQAVVAEACPPSGASVATEAGWEAILRPAGWREPLRVHPGARFGAAEVTAIRSDRVCYRIGETRGEWRWEGRQSYLSSLP